MTIFSIIKEFFYLHPKLEVILFLSSVTQLIFLIGMIVGAFFMRKYVLAKLPEYEARWKHYKEQAAHGEKYREDAGKASFWRKEAESKSHELVRCRNKLSAIADLTISELKS